MSTANRTGNDRGGTNSDNTVSCTLPVMIDAQEKTPLLKLCAHLISSLAIERRKSSGVFSGHQRVLRRINVIGWHNFQRDDLSQMYRNALAISDTEDIGLSVGLQLHLSAHGPLGVATYSCPDLRTALNLLATYGQTRTEVFDISLHQHAEGLRVNFAETQELDDLRVFVTESVLSGLFAAIHFFSAQHNSTANVSLRIPSRATAALTAITLETG